MTTNLLEFEGIAMTANNDNPDTTTALKTADEPGKKHSEASQAVVIASVWDAKLDAMSALKQGWNSYSADPPSPNAIEIARRFIRHLESNGLPPTRVAPSVVGGVGVTRKVGDKRAYFEFYNDGTAHVMLAEGAEARTFPLLNSIDALAEARAYLNG
jgi:hypothetical protein